MNNDRLKFRTPVYDIFGNFIYFVYWVAGESKRPPLPRKLSLYKYGKDEQCTALHDKNRNLIYDGDIVRDSLLGRKYTVKWDCDNVQFEATANVYDTEFSEIYGLYVDSAKELEIIGNIHEQKD